MDPPAPSEKGPTTPPRTETRPNLQTETDDTEADLEPPLKRPNYGKKRPLLQPLPRNLQSQNVVDLRKLCSSRSVKLSSKDRKQQIIQKLEENERIKNRMVQRYRLPTPEEPCTPGKRSRETDPDDSEEEGLQPSQKEAKVAVESSKETPTEMTSDLKANTSDQLQATENGSEVYQSPRQPSKQLKLTELMKSMSKKKNTPESTNHCKPTTPPNPTQTHQEPCPNNRQTSDPILTNTDMKLKIGRKPDEPGETKGVRHKPLLEKPTKKNNFSAKFYCYLQFYVLTFQH